jgi:hypothetical protein
LAGAASVVAAPLLKLAPAVEAAPLLKGSLGAWTGMTIHEPIGLVATLRPDQAEWNRIMSRHMVALAPGLRLPGGPVSALTAGSSGSARCASAALHG